MNMNNSTKIKNSQEPNEFLNKKIVVTGASSGIGLTTSLFFLNCGAKVIMASHDIITMKKICEKYRFYNAIIMKLVLRDDINIYDFKNSIVKDLKP